MDNRIKEILLKGKTPDSEFKDQQEMLSLFHQPEMEYEIKDELVKELDGYIGSEESFPGKKRVFTKLWETIENKEQQKNIRVRYLNITVKIAAALITGLFLGIYITSLLNKQEPVFYTAHSPEGSVSELTLPDGTLIFLNSGSNIKYSISGKNEPREVFLSGEAWFQVEKNKKKPFLVHTPLYEVQVTGTRFNVKAYEEENKVTTTLEEGEVIIYTNANREMEQGFVLRPGQQLMLTSGSAEPVIQQVNTRWYTAWKDNKLILVNMPLKELIVLLERKYGVDFVIKDENVLNYHCDATFQGESLIELMDILKKMLPIDYNIVGQNIEITTKPKIKEVP